ncbi:MAG: hypothetical protein JWP46_2020 [Modestobacter sp.]|nr:hypothetical protein [Modestobacter sp.]
MMFLTIVAFLPPSYLLLGVLRAVLGKPGLSLSPLLAAAAIGLIWTLTLYRERQLKSRDARWKEHNDGWVRYLQVLAAVTIMAPVVLGLTWPLVVLPDVNPAVGFMLSAVPTVGLIAVVTVNRYRYLKSGGQP